MERIKIENGNTYIVKTDPETGIEITDTLTDRPKITIAKGRVALKFHKELSQEDRAPYIKYAKGVAAKIGDPEFTLRGKFAVTNDGIEYLQLAAKGKQRRFRFDDGEIIEHLLQTPCQA